MSTCKITRMVICAVPESKDLDVIAERFSHLPEVCTKVSSLSMTWRCNLFSAADMSKDGEKYVENIRTRQTTASSNSEYNLVIEIDFKKEE